MTELGCEEGRGEKGRGGGERKETEIRGERKERERDGDEGTGV